MDSGQTALTAWSYGLAGLAYTVLALHLWRIGHAGQRAGRWMLAAVVAMALWGWCGLADLFSATVPLFDEDLTKSDSLQSSTTESVQTPVQMSGARVLDDD